jgi:hypothetical protein
VPENVSDLVTEVIAQGAFDATTTDVLKWFNRRHKEMVNAARGYRKTLTIGTTTAGTQAYNVPAGVIELTDITVVGEASSTGVSQIALGPAPSTTGDSIMAPNAAVTPPDLLIDNSVPLVIDDDMIEGLMAGVFATALGRPNEARPDLAGAQEAVFQQKKAEYSRRVARRLRGAGPSRIRIGLPGRVVG